MKKIIIGVFTIFCFMSFSIKAKAFDEYRVYVNGANSIDVKKVVSNNSTTTLSDYSSILTYSDSVLTLKEGNHFDYIEVNYGPFTITSENKLVYVNTILDPTSSIRNVVLNELYSKSYISSFTPSKWFNYNGVHYLIYSFIGLNGNLRITNSNIDVRILNSAASSSVQNGNIMTYYGHINILDSTIVCDGGPFNMSSTSKLIIKNSNITTLGTYDQGYAINTSGGDINIEDSTFDLKTGIGLYSEDSYIKNSNFKIDDSTGFVFQIYAGTIENTSIDTGYLRVNSQSDVKKVTINNCNISFSKYLVVGRYYSYNNTEYNYIGDVDFNDCTIDGGDTGIIELYTTSSLSFNNSIINVNDIRNGYGDTKKTVTIDKGTASFKNINLKGTIDIKDATLNIDEDAYIEADTSVKIKNINDIKLDYIKGGTIDIDNANIDITKTLSSTDDVTISDSTISTYGTRVAGNFVLNNSYYKTQTLSSEKTYSPFIVTGDVDVTNSRLIASSDGTVPSVLVKGDITLNDSTFKDDNKKILTVSDITVSNDNFLSSSETYGNSNYVSVGDSIKTTTLNGNLADYSETSGYYEVKIKVFNGTWSDGTTDATTYKILLGEKAEDNLPNDMIANDGYVKGSWKLVDGDYVYTFVKKTIINPKTGVKSTIGTLVVIAIMLVILLMNKRNITLFKRI